MKNYSIYYIFGIGLLLFFAIYYFILNPNCCRDQLLLRIQQISGIAIFTIAFITLYFNFLKPSKTRLKMGKIMLIWHDNSLNLSPMLDLFCSVINDGAKSRLVDSFQIKLIKKDTKTTTLFEDLLFLKNSDGKNWMMDSYSHPVFIDKYSSQSFMVGFYNKDINYCFSAGEYLLKTSLLESGKIIASNNHKFKLNENDLEKIKKNKSTNGTIEIMIEQFKNHL